MPNIIFHASAEKEYKEAFAWYYQQSEPAALEFEDAVARALEQIADHPEQGVPFGRLHRCRLLKRFPYLVVYRTDRDPILIVAVAHGRRRPRYWRNRR
jgi:plasmid stabilization system protein ParE